MCLRSSTVNAANVKQRSQHRNQLERGQDTRVAVCNSQDKGNRQAVCVATQHVITQYDLQDARTMYLLTSAAHLEVMHSAK